MPLCLLSLVANASFSGPVELANPSLSARPGLANKAAQQASAVVNIDFSPTADGSIRSGVIRLADLNATGRQLFLNNCSACHQEDGKGIPNVYPALAGSEVVNGSGEDVLYLLIAGRGDMPSFQGAFDSEEAQALLHYLVSAWGNSGKPVEQERLQKILEAYP